MKTQAFPRFVAPAVRRFVSGWWVLLTVIPLLACQAHPRTPAGTASKPDSTAAAPDVRFERIFAEHGDGWTGGDGTVSLRLPDGRTLWLFGDSFLGVIEPDGRRSAATPFIRNCLLVQVGDRLTTLYGQRGGVPVAFFRPTTQNEWYWPGDGTIKDQHLFIFLHRFRRLHPGLWGWQWTGTDLARLSLPGLEIEAIQPLPTTREIRWGVALFEHRAQIYIYGVVDKAGQRDLHVARTSADALAGPWSYFNGRRWAAASHHSAGILSGVSSQFGLVVLRKVFVLVTMDERRPFSGRLVAYAATRPEGPFQGPTFLYEAPEAGNGVAAYNPFVHPQFTQRGRFLISYNVNHLHDPQIHFRNARLYRPRFIRVDLASSLRLPQEVIHDFGGSWQ